ncbi:MAG: glucosamine-6-phosphate deaminase [Ruminococcaceae bacterium]|nr:glucosamine-6-phosphate deaminase [Oscillospiraceae bacterium]
MRVIVCLDYNEMSMVGARFVSSQLTLKPDSVLGLATGLTPVGMYNILSDMNKKGEIDFSKVKSFNLDEYYKIAPDNEQSYHYFMEKNLFSKVNIKRENTHILDGLSENPEEECERFDKLIQEKGGIDLQILGIGRNGHIGFNEPDKELYSNTHLTPLTQSTIEANSVFFESEDEMPKSALTMGMSSILKSKRIIIMANGESKKDAVARLLSGKISTDLPASLLNIHPDVILICDKAAYSSVNNK